MSGNVKDARLFDHDAQSGITEYFHYDPDTDGFAIESRQDVTALVETNKALWNDTEKSTRYGDGIGGRVASIPNVVLMELSKQGIVSASGVILDEKRMKRWLNDSSNRCFRTRPGTV